MFPQVIPRAIRNVCANSARFCTAANIDNTRLEKTINQVTLLGRVGAEPQKRGNSEHPVVVFSLATHTNYKHVNGDLSQRTEWHKVCVFRPLLRETVSLYLKKGQRVLVTGKISYGEFKDEDGNAKPVTAVIADDVVFFHAP